MRSLLRSLLVGSVILVISAAMGLWVPVTAQAHFSCAVSWGSLGKAGTRSTTAEVFDVRAGRHTCFDRLVVDIAGNAAGAYDIRYVEGGWPGLRGGAILQVLVRAPIANQNPRFIGVGDLVDVSGYRTFRQVGWGSSYQGRTFIGLGVRARLPFRVFVLPGPGSASRLVVDVAHRW